MLPPSLRGFRFWRLLLEVPWRFSCKTQRYLRPWLPLRRLLLLCVTRPGKLFQPLEQQDQFECVCRLGYSNEVDNT